MNAKPSCPSGKRKFPSEEAATAVIRRMWSHQYRGGKKLLTRAYQCENCRHWHTTSKRAPKKPLPMPEPQWDKIGPRIRQAREEAGLDQQTLAIRIGVNLNTMIRFEEGRSNISASRMEQIARVTHRTEFWLRYGREG